MSHVYSLVTRVLQAKSVYALVTHRLHTKPTLFVETQQYSTQLTVRHGTALTVNKHCGHSVREQNTRSILTTGSAEHVTVQLYGD